MCMLYLYCCSILYVFLCIISPPEKLAFHQTKPHGGCRWGGWGIGSVTLNILKIKQKRKMPRKKLPGTY